MLEGLTNAVTKSGDFQNWRSLIKRVLFLDAVLIGCLVLWPIENTITRLVSVAAVFGGCLGFLFLCWDVPKLRNPLLVAVLCGFSVAGLSGRSFDTDILAREYVRALQVYRGVRYVWGGEGALGIDCSGLVRKAMVVALASHGFRSLNGRPIRDALGVWSYDCSALALRDGYRG
ncbi:MAG: C40 family peptidase, partial [Verrucomicrobiae bacterium]|nr:C40 family peptidase [Verrucomicrobiae bacterium]